LRPLDPLKGTHDGQRERGKAVVIDVGQFTLGLRPDELIRIELRAIAGKAGRLPPGMTVEKAWTFRSSPTPPKRTTTMIRRLLSRTRSSGTWNWA